MKLAVPPLRVNSRFNMPFYARTQMRGALTASVPRIRRRIALFLLVSNEKRLKCFRLSEQRHIVAPSWAQASRAPSSLSSCYRNAPRRFEGGHIKSRLTNEKFIRADCQRARRDKVNATCLCRISSINRWRSAAWSKVSDSIDSPRRTTNGNILIYVPISDRQWNGLKI